MFDKTTATIIVKALEAYKTADTTSELMRERALGEMRNIASGDTIASLWSIEDVQEAANLQYGYEDDGQDIPSHPITDQVARDVLEASERNHDATQGINWDTLAYWIDEVEQA